MELKKVLAKYNIVGVISNYKFNLDENKLVSEVIKRKIDQALKIVGLDNSIKNKYVKELSEAEKFKIDLISKVNKEVIIIGNLSNMLNYKERNNIKKILLKISKSYNKKIIIIDNDINSIMDIIEYYFVLKNNKLVYKTRNVYDDELYKYTTMPPIISFVKEANKKGANLKEYTNIHELLKAIYRSVS